MNSNIDKYLNRPNAKQDIDSDIIRGKRLTNLESMSLLIQDPIQIDQEVLDEVLTKYIKWK